jgi:hypothetical protein
VAEQRGGVFYCADALNNHRQLQYELPICADWDFNLRCWAVAKFKYIDVAVAKFYVGGLQSVVASTSGSAGKLRPM